MRVTMNFEISSKPKKNGTYPIYLRLTENSRHFKKVQNVTVLNRKHFNAQAKYGYWINSKEPLAKIFNSKLSDVIESANRLKSELDDRNELTAQNLFDAINGNTVSKSFLIFIEQKRQEYYDRRQWSYADIINNLKKKLETFTKGREIYFHDITHSFITHFITYLSKYRSKNGNHLAQSTIFDIIAKFKMLHRQAITEKYITGIDNPFSQIKIRQARSNKEPLSEVDIEKITNLDLEEKTLLWHVRNSFLFSMYMAGIRIGDILNLRWSSVQDGRLRYKMLKTKKDCSTVIHPKAKEILDLYCNEGCKSTDYIFPFMNHYKNRGTVSEADNYNQKKSKTFQINLQLKRIAVMAGIEKNISFHIARHTFTNIAVQNEGNIYIISQMLGHSSLKITEHYLSTLNYQRHDEFLSNIFK